MGGKDGDGGGRLCLENYDIMIYLEREIYIYRSFWHTIAKNVGQNEKRINKDVTGECDVNGRGVI